MDKKICKINDPRISGHTNRTRSGSTQEFYTGNDARDWDRYNKDGGGIKSNVVMHLKPDTIHITPPKVSYYAELIDGEWWWVEGCAECNGRPRSSITYVECEEHNVCQTCKVPMSEVSLAYGCKGGWMCKKCSDEEHEAEKKAALDAMPEEFSAYDYKCNDQPKCPYCDFEFEEDDFYSSIDHEETHECPRCDNDFIVNGETSVTFTTSRKGEDNG